LSFNIIPSFCKSGVRKPQKPRMIYQVAILFFHIVSWYCTNLPMHFAILFSHLINYLLLFSVVLISSTLSVDTVIVLLQNLTFVLDLFLAIICNIYRLWWLIGEASLNIKISLSKQLSDIIRYKNQIWICSKFLSSSTCSNLTDGSVILTYIRYCFLAPNHIYLNGEWSNSLFGLQGIRIWGIGFSTHLCFCLLRNCKVLIWVLMD